MTKLIESPHHGLFGLTVYVLSLLPIASIYPDTSSCAPFFTIPEGCYALVTDAGADIDYEDGQVRVAT